MISIFPLNRTDMLVGRPQRGSTRWHDTYGPVPHRSSLQDHMVKCESRNRVFHWIHRWNGKFQSSQGAGEEVDLAQKLTRPKHAFSGAE